MVKNWTGSMATRIEDELSSMESFQAVQDVLCDIKLHDLQCVDVMKMLYMKRAICIYDTGTGKTLLAAAVMKLLWNEDPSRKFIIFVKKDQLAQTPQKLEKACEQRVIASAADYKSISNILSSNYTAYSILMLTHDCLCNPAIMNALFQVRSQYCGVIIDEAHDLQNFNHTDSARLLSGITQNFEYCWALTATPIVSNLIQLAKLANIVDNQRYPNYTLLSKNLASGVVRVKDDPCFFINRNRAEFGSNCEYRGIVEWCAPLPHQKIPCGGNKMFQLCKGSGAHPQANKLVDVIQQRVGKRGLIFINQHEVRSWVMPFLGAANIRYALINGVTSFANRVQIMQQFNEEKSLDVVITSVTTAIDLDCDYVVFYEFTIELKQMIGRAHRGLGDKSLDVIFIITDDSSEVEYFSNNILQKSFLVRDILGKDFSEIEDAEKGLEAHYVIN